MWIILSSLHDLNFLKALRRGNLVYVMINWNEPMKSFVEREIFPFFAVLFEFPASTYADIQMKGVLVLGQTKDSTPDGNFDEAQSFSGRMAQFGLWDRVLAQNEIFQMAGAILSLNSLPLNLQHSFSQRLQIHYCRESVFVWLLIFIGYVEKEQCQLGKCHWHYEFLRSIGCTEQAGIARNPTTSYS